MLNPEEIKKWLGVVAAGVTLIGGGYTTLDKLDFFHSPILTWAPEHFSITDGPPDGNFKVIVAREKHRDDCSVEGFKLEVRDSDYIVHVAKPSIPTFSGPASKKIGKFAFSIHIEDPENVAEGEATLLAHIEYECPEGKVTVNYPDHENLRFNISKSIPK